MCNLVRYKNSKLVADIKLPYIIIISKQAEKAKNISRIMLFGSSIEERCTEESDIDIAVFGKKIGEDILTPRNLLILNITYFVLTGIRIMMFCILRKTIKVRLL